MFVLGRPFCFYPNVIFASKVRNSTLTTTQVGYGLTHRRYTFVEKLAWDKHYSLLGQVTVTEGEGSVQLTSLLR